MTDKTLDGKTYWYCEDCGRLCHGGPHDCKKITRQDAEEALRIAVELAKDALGDEQLAAILRQCRIIEPGGLDAETRQHVGGMLRYVFGDMDESTATFTITSEAFYALLRAIEKGE